MRPGWLRYYERYSAWASVAFLWHAWRAPSKLRRLSTINRSRDYARLAGDPERLALHGELHRHLLAAAEQWEPYDYGEGYFYQSSPSLGITGLRDTAARIEALGLRDAVADGRVLEIGCNAGFLAAELAPGARRWVGFDVNPHLVAIARRVAPPNAEIVVSRFEDLAVDERFDLVLSLANHSTYDGQTEQTLVEYFGRCHDRLEPGGTLVFESHPPELEGAGLQDLVRLIGERFEIERREVLDYGTFLDRGRTFVRARRRPE